MQVAEKEPFTVIDPLIKDLNYPLVNVLEKGGSVIYLNDGTPRHTGILISSKIVESG